MTHRCISRVNSLSYKPFLPFGCKPLPSVDSERQLRWTPTDAPVPAALKQPHRLHLLRTRQGQLQVPIARIHDNLPNLLIRQPLPLVILFNAFRMRRPLPLMTLAFESPGWTFLSQNPSLQPLNHINPTCLRNSHRVQW